MKRHQVISILLAGLFCLCSSGCNVVRNVPVLKDALQRQESEAQKKIDEIVSKRPSLKKLNDVCSSLGGLNDFVLIRRAISIRGEDEMYFYYDSKRPVSEGSTTIAEFLTNDEWIREQHEYHHQIDRFRKGTMKIGVEFSNFGEWRYGVTCSSTESKEQL